MLLFVFFNWFNFFFVFVLQIYFMNPCECLQKCTLKKIILILVYTSSTVWSLVFQKLLLHLVPVGWLWLGQGGVSRTRPSDSCLCHSQRWWAYKSMGRTGGSSPLRCPRAFLPVSIYWSTLLYCFFSGIWVGVGWHY